MSDAQILSDTLFTTAVVVAGAAAFVLCTNFLIRYFSGKEDCDGKISFRQFRSLYSIAPEKWAIDDGLYVSYRLPVPPHGRLIDADALRELYEEWESDKEAGIDIDKCHVPIPVIRQNIDDAPTIIPADKAEEGEA